MQPASLRVSLIISRAAALAASPCFGSSTTCPAITIMRPPDRADPRPAGREAAAPGAGALRAEIRTKGARSGVGWPRSRRPTALELTGRVPPPGAGRAKPEASMNAVDRNPSFPRGFALLCLALAAWALLGGGGGCNTVSSPHEAVGNLNFTSPQVNPVVVSVDGQTAYVANTTSNTVSFVATSPLHVTRTVSVGMEPVSLALRPDGLELWVSNHVSDSVRVIDLDPVSASFGAVVETVQALD